MNGLDYIKQLLELKKKHPSKELKVECKDGIFRIDLTPENLRLWNETINRFKQPCNILLACDSNQTDLMKSRLTWVVGSAIRPAHITTPNEAMTLLKSLGVQKELALTAKNTCPGLGELTWAFYFDRHDSLTASPTVIL